MPQYKACRTFGFKGKYTTGNMKQQVTKDKRRFHNKF